MEGRERHSWTSQIQTKMGYSCPFCRNPVPAVCATLSHRINLSTPDASFRITRDLSPEKLSHLPHSTPHVFLFRLLCQVQFLCQIPTHSMQGVSSRMEIWRWGRGSDLRGVQRVSSLTCATLHGSVCMSSPRVVMERTCNIITSVLVQAKSFIIRHCRKRAISPLRKERQSFSGRRGRGNSQDCLALLLHFVVAMLPWMGG